MEAFLSVALCGLSKDALEEIRVTFNAIYPKVEISAEAQTQMLELLKYDKKNSHGIVKFALLEALGKPKIDVEVPLELLEQAFEDYRN